MNFRTSRKHHTTAEEARSLMEGYLRFRKKCKEWQDGHDVLLRKLSSFHGQLDSMRGKLSVNDSAVLNRPMDPFSVEELFASIQEMPAKLEAILLDMYAIYQETKRSQADRMDGNAPLCSRRDYIGFIGVEIDMYEAEFQHIETAVNSLHFDTPSNVWNTYITSLSTQPFLDMDVLSEITEKHNFSYQHRLNQLPG
ncbi:hypothetical protein H310_09585 [Aphanomyces invadans]|uniref:Uncharacterized protein n=1 Tax=Aphanomyces invadans TaxID=157072 RepID=A0A024TU52_9STRA|nr:hypothetical protein H310_09585 [Aphanomyces invadans]ETV97700.1 hypothetical protein H310_09585 [Aphanomyces invadans]|eukprot:XP_008873909.1 hypothetical protein H310_09585 [Aphanomyces invadans]